MTRTIEHGNRNGYASLGAGGLSQESFPMRLFAKGNAKHWNPAEIDFAQDAKDFAAMTDDERLMTITLAAQFMAGEESVTQDLQPFIAAMAAEGRLADEMYLTQFVYEEAKHTLSFRLWFDAVGLTQDLHEHVEFNDPYIQIFTRELPASLYALEQDSSARNQIRASVTYNHVIEGALALTGYYAWQKVCTSRGILPGMQKIIKHIGDDERRHMAWGTFTCRRHVAADDGPLAGRQRPDGRADGPRDGNCGRDLPQVRQRAAVRDRPRRDDRLRHGQTHPPARSDRIRPGRRPAHYRPGRLTRGAGGKVPLGGPASDDGLSLDRNLFMFMSKEP